MLQKYQYHVKISLLPWLPAAVTAAGKTGLVALIGLLGLPFARGNYSHKTSIMPQKGGEMFVRAAWPSPWWAGHIWRYDAQNCLCAASLPCHWALDSTFSKILTSNLKYYFQSEKMVLQPGRAGIGFALFPVFLAFRKDLTSWHSCFLYQRTSH